MALATDHCLVPPGKGKCSPRMVEATGRRPPVLGVAIEAGVAQLPQVRILMATRAVTAQAKECPREVPDSQALSGRVGEILRRMTGPTLLPGMCTLQRKPRHLVMGERRSIELHHRKVPAIVFHMTACTIRLSLRHFVTLRMETASGSQTAANLTVTTDTAETSRPGPEIVARGTLRHTLQRLVGPRQGTR